MKVFEQKKLKFNNVKDVKFSNGLLSFTRNDVKHTFNNIASMNNENNTIDIEFSNKFGFPFAIGDFIVHNIDNSCRLVIDIKNNNEIHMAKFSTYPKFAQKNKITILTKRIKNIKEFDNFRFATEDEISKFMNTMKEKKTLLFDKVNSKIYDIESESFYKDGDYVVYNEDELGYYSGIEMVNDLPCALKMTTINDNQVYAIEDLSKVRKVTEFEMKLINEYMHIN